MTANNAMPKGMPMPPLPPMPPVPPLPFMPPMPNNFPMPGSENAQNAKESAKAKAGELAAGMKSILEKNLDMGKAFQDTSKDQYDQFFAYIMDMEDGFAETLPEELPALFGLPVPPVSPKGIAKTVKEFQEMANEHFTEQASSAADFFFDAQQKAVDMVPDAPKAEEAETTEVEVESDEKVEDDAE